MKSANLVWALCLSFIFLFGCSQDSYNDTMTGSRIVAQPQPVNYSGPKMTVVVAEIVNRTGTKEEVLRTGTTIQTGSAAVPPDKELLSRDPIGFGMRDQLITSLTQTGVFAVIRTNGDGQTEANSIPAQYLIEGAVTEYEPSQTSIAGGYGWGVQRRAQTSDPTVSAGNVFSQVLAPSAIGGLFKKDHIAMNIHLVEVNTNTIIASTAVEASPKDLGAATNLLFGTSRIADVGAQSQTPMHKAIRACMAKAAVWAANVVTSRRI
jgi:curli biogenesis system outer membrane secretion channel CsgG